MSEPVDRRLRAVVVAAHDSVVRARGTVRSATSAGALDCTVVDLDGGYVPVGSEQVWQFASLAAEAGARTEAEVAAATLAPDLLAPYAAALAAVVLTRESNAPVLLLEAGVLVLGDPRFLLAGGPGPVVARAVDTATALRRARSGARGPLFATSLVLVHDQDQAAALRALCSAWQVADRALDLFAVEAGAVVTDALVTPWRRVTRTERTSDGGLVADGFGVVAVDLTGLDPDSPWLLDSEATVAPAVLLSEHPALAEMVAVEAQARRADASDLPATEAPGRLVLDDALRAEARRAAERGDPLPDLLGPDARDDVFDWSLALIPEDHPQPTARYLAALRLDRPHLRRTYTSVPGADSSDLAQWALKAGPARTVDDPRLLARAAELTLAAQRDLPAITGRGPLAPGVNLIGYLSGELGLGESARLVDQALQSAGVATSTHDVSGRLQSRRTAGYRRTEPTVHDTSLLCVNGTETAKLAPELGQFLEHTRVIGMWYWELEEVPESQQAGFAFVDEVWAATDFMRDAFARVSGDVPVRTVTPPLPQATGDRGRVPESFGVRTEGPWFLFTFDFLSGAERKNPDGLIDAFTRAFGHLAPTERPQLVIKTINGARRPADAERLRLQAQGRDDVLVLDTYLENDQRHVLVANCTAYVSLHRAEGLGLTVAEAMAWGKPVITTAYGGVTQFCTDENAMLVPWTRGHVRESFGPYARGMAWAEPDLDAAAALMRSVVDDPSQAAARGARAADDIRQLHSAQAAGVRMRAALDDGPPRAQPAAAHPDGPARRLARSGRERLRRMRS